MNEYSFMSSIWKRKEAVISTRDKNNDKYHRILEAAVRVFAEQGFYQSTVSQIAREAGVADGTIYLYGHYSYLDALEGNRPVARSAWPLFRGNSRNTGHVGEPSR